MNLFYATYFSSCIVLYNNSTTVLNYMWLSVSAVPVMQWWNKTHWWAVIEAVMSACSFTFPPCNAAIYLTYGISGRYSVLYLAAIHQLTTPPAKLLPDAVHCPLCCLLQILQRRINLSLRVSPAARSIIGASARMALMFAYIWRQPRTVGESAYTSTMIVLCHTSAILLLSSPVVKTNNYNSYQQLIAERTSAVCFRLPAPRRINLLVVRPTIAYTWWNSMNDNRLQYHACWVSLPFVAALLWLVVELCLRCN